MKNHLCYYQLNLSYSDKRDEVQMKPSLLVTLASDMRIQTVRLHVPVESCEQFPDLGLRSSLLGSSTPFDEELPPVDPSADRLQVWLIRDSFRCHYFMGTNPERDQVWLMGPYLTEDMTFAQMTRCLDRTGLKNADMQFLHQYYSMLPRIRDENLMYSIIHSHCADTYGADRFEISYWEMTFRHTPKPSGDAPVRAEYQRDAMEYVYAQEGHMMDCIAQGNLHGALTAIHRLEKKGIESRTTSTLRDMKNFSIVFNTLCRIAARNGGAHPYDIDLFSRITSIQIENAASIKELMSVRDTALKEYCAMVRSAHQKTYSPAIQQAVDIIEARFSRHLTLKDIAAELKLNANYLSVRFKQETGKPLSEYLAGVRMNYARQLLERTDLPIASIAVECGIPDNNYFARFFHRTENMTPREYRIKCRQASKE